MKVPQSFLEGFIMFVLLIPIGIFYLIKWVIKGIVILVITFKQK